MRPFERASHGLKRSLLTESLEPKPRPQRVGQEFGVTIELREIVLPDRDHNTDELVCIQGLGQLLKEALPVLPVLKMGGEELLELVEDDRSRCIQCISFRETPPSLQERGERDPSELGSLPHLVRVPLVSRRLTRLRRVFWYRRVRRPGSPSPSFAHYLGPVRQSVENEDIGHVTREMLVADEAAHSAEWHHLEALFSFQCWNQRRIQQRSLPCSRSGIEEDNTA